MDPLSVSASILTVLAAVTTAIRSAKIFRDAPNDAQALLNELADVQLVVANIESSLVDLDPSRFTKVIFLDPQRRRNGLSCV
jgi:hypothetical protein